VFVPRFWTFSLITDPGGWSGGIGGLIAIVKRALNSIGIIIVGAQHGDVASSCSLRVSIFDPPQKII